MDANHKLIILEIFDDVLLQLLNYIHLRCQPESLASKQHEAAQSFQYTLVKLRDGLLNTLK